VFAFVGTVTKNALEALVKSAQRVITAIECRGGDAFAFFDVIEGVVDAEHALEGMKGYAVIFFVPAPDGVRFYALLF